MTMTDTKELRLEVAQANVARALVEAGASQERAAEIAASGKYSTFAGGSDVLIDFPGHRAVHTQPESVRALVGLIYHDPVASGRRAAEEQRRKLTPDALAFR